MKKFAPTVGILLAAALVFMSIPTVRAEENISLRASGIVQQSVPAAEDGSVILSKVAEGAADWSDLPNLNMFPAAEYLRPGSSGDYQFTLHNLYSQPISYVFTHSAAAATIPISYTLTQGEYAGTLPKGGSASFTLHWDWPYYVDEPKDDSDSRLGVASAKAANRTDYEVTLKFEIEAEETEKQEWPDWLMPGILVGGALAGGGLLAALASAPLWLLPLALPVVGVGWMLTKLTDTAEQDDTSGLGVPSYVMPPKTGDNWTLSLLAGIGLVQATGTMLAILKIRKKEEAG